MTDKNSPKVARRFKCIYCDYICRKPSDYNKHLITRKHITTYKQLTDTDAIAKTIAKYECTCGNSYKHRQSLHNHKKKCSIAQGNNTTNLVIDNTTDNKGSSAEIDKEMLVKMLLKNQEVMEKMMEMIPNMGNITNTNSHNNTTNNNQFNIQMFLNNHCKNAMNLTDFIDSLPITAETYDSNIDNGLTNTIANMFTTGLNQLDILERPIHCTDASRKTLYVKEGDVWEKDNELTKMIQGIRQMAAKQRILINTWRDAHDDWNVNDRMQDRFTTLVCNMVEDIENQEKETNKIIRSVSKEVYLNNDTKNKYLGQA
jgi:hypothetical protein